MEENSLDFNKLEKNHVRTKKVKTILPDLKEYPFDDEIKNMADVIYNSMGGKVHRKNIRKQLLYFCVYNAHVTLNRDDINKDAIGSAFNLTSDEIVKCDSLFPPIKTGYHPPVLHITPSHYLGDFARKMNLSESSVKELRNLSDDIIAKDKSLLRDLPQTIAAGILAYYIKKEGIIFSDKRLIVDVTKRSLVTINNVLKKIEFIDNNIILNKNLS